MECILLLNHLNLKSACADLAIGEAALGDKVMSGQTGKCAAERVPSQ